MPPKKKKPQQKETAKVVKLTKKQKAALWQQNLLDQIHENVNTTAQSVSEFIKTVPVQVWNILKRKDVGTGLTVKDDGVDIVAICITSIEMDNVIHHDAKLAALSYMGNRSPIHAMVVNDPHVRNETTARIKYQQVFAELKQRSAATTTQSQPCPPSSESESEGESTASADSKDSADTTVSGSINTSPEQQQQQQQQGNSSESSHKRALQGLSLNVHIQAGQYQHQHQHLHQKKQRVEVDLTAATSSPDEDSTTAGHMHVWVVYLCGGDDVELAGDVLDSHKYHDNTTALKIHTQNSHTYTHEDNCVNKPHRL